MGRELSDVFKAKTRVGKRKVLDKFDISEEDKNKFLNGIESDSGESSSIEYLDVSGSEVGKGLCCLYSYQNKILVKNGVISITSAIRSYNNTYIARSICFYDTIIVANDKTTILEYLETSGITKDQLDALPRITKEQFYSLE